MCQRGVISYTQRMPKSDLLPRALQGERDFRWRGGEVSRIETLTDMVFALSLTLLVVAPEVPKSYEEMTAAFRHLPTFAICFSMLILVWYYNYQFHRRFGFEDFTTILLNGLLLFLILFYIYPLKFVFSNIVDHVLYGQSNQIHIHQRDMPTLMLLYSTGYTGIFLLFALLNLHAYRQRSQLGLNAVEVALTRGTVRTHLLYAAVGLLSIAIVLLDRDLVGIAGLVYFFIGPLQGINGYLSGREVRNIKRGSSG